MKFAMIVVVALLSLVIDVTLASPQNVGSPVEVIEEQTKCLTLRSPRGLPNNMYTTWKLVSTTAPDVTCGAMSFSPVIQPAVIELKSTFRQSEKDDSFHFLMVRSLPFKYAVKEIPENFDVNAENAVATINAVASVYQLTVLAVTNDALCLYTCPTTGGIEGLFIFTKDGFSNSNSDYCENNIPEAKAGLHRVTSTDCEI